MSCLSFPAFRCIAIGGSLWALLPALALATADGPDFYRVVGAEPELAVYAEPDAAAAILGTIPTGSDCVRNLGCQGGLTLEEFTTLDEAAQAARLREKPRWCRVEFKGLTGWVPGVFLREGDCYGLPDE
ncbi:MAG: SH3 domain-containing protein [Chromatiaceae bacterium]|nr:MAG: SH3 domain-containing protein [Chromatiaceae bacterium]